MIILTAADAAKVLGRSPPPYDYAALEPFPLKDGTYMLPEEVLLDPAHADVRDFLAALPTKTPAKAEQFDLGAVDKPVDPAEKQAYDAAKLDYAAKGERPKDVGP